MKMDQDGHDLAGAEVRRTAALRRSLRELRGVPARREDVPEIIDSTEQFQ
jgi:hypothetical protein